MTKEELKKEFEEYLKDSADYYDPREPFTDRKLLQLWLDCAEPREKQIQIDAEQIRALQKQNGELTDEVDSLKLQISDLIKQRQYWKDSSFDWRHKFFKKGLVKRLVAKDKQLNKAKEIIKKFLLWENGWHKKTESKYELLKQAESFLNSEVAK